MTGAAVTDRAQMHRRAQKAEGLLARARVALADLAYRHNYWFEEYLSERDQRLAMASELRRHRLQQPDPLARIIAMGEQFP